MSLLSVSGLTAGYGGITALKGIDLHVENGEIVTLIGANGAGKSTTLRVISGLIKKRTGEICFKGQDISRTPAHRIVSLGMAHVPEGRGIFQRLSVVENLQLGAFQRNDGEVPRDMERVFALFPRLFERRAQQAGTLWGG
jgi:branched-chain amino acid transport system ATP-binding protein